MTAFSPNDRQHMLKDTILAGLKEVITDCSAQGYWMHISNKSYFKERYGAKISLSVTARELIKLTGEWNPESCWLGAQSGSDGRLCTVKGGGARN